MLFARARELCGVKEIAAFELAEGSDASVDGFLAAMVARFPPLGGAVASCGVAVNQEYVGRDHVLRGGEEVALIPPISGGR